jgi:hypothetical protein
VRTDKAVNVRGGSRDPNRGKWCTEKKIADAVGPFDLDPFSNPRSHIVATHACMLERDEDGMVDRSRPGSYLLRDPNLGLVQLTAGPEDRAWIQPPYNIVEEALDHYGNTRFAALLRFDPRPAWFRTLWRLTRLVCVLRKVAFEPPPGVKASTNTFPHAIYYSRVEDATPAILRMCISWRTGKD